MSQDEISIFCANCGFYEEIAGECRRRAPTAALDFQWGMAVAALAGSGQAAESAACDTRTCWPKVRRRDWCGEFQAARDLQQIET